MSWETVIGLEIHVQLSTKSKLFSGGSTEFGAESNTHVDLIDMGLPGVLPVANKEAFYKAIRFGLATGANINQTSSFDRKNYFYPDLPKGYQITQMTQPIVEKGSIKIAVDDYEKEINITRAHLEEDAGKSIHDMFEGETGVDLNRAGTPLLEIVSEPEISSAKEAVAYFKAIRQLVTFLDICDGNMAQGSMRCDVNVSIKKSGDIELGTRAELKNINDYRYFPCPDLLPVIISDKELKEIKENLPELPEEKEIRYINEIGLDESEAKIISSSKTMANMFEAASSKTDDAKLVAKWLVGDISALLNKDNIDIDESNLSAENFGILIERISDGTISGKIAKSVLEEVWETASDVDEIIQSKGLVQIQDESILEDIAKKVIESNPNQVSAYKAGKDKLFGFFVGQIMKETQGKANPKAVNEILKDLLQ